MKLNIHPLKRKNMVMLYAVFIVGFLYKGLINAYHDIQIEQKNFFEAELSNCQVTGIIEKQHKRMRGSYELFQTNCSDVYYPIRFYALLEVRELLKEGAIVFKNPNSAEVLISKNGQEVTASLRDYKGIDSRPLGLKMMGGALLVITIIFILIPNSLFEKLARGRMK